jgi:hypothetical protein
MGAWRDTVIAAAIAVATLNAAAGSYGALRWYRVEQSRGFWVALRAAQASAFAFALLVGALWIASRRATDDLFYLYALLPLAVGLVAEQLRIAAAEQVLASRDLENAQQVGQLPADQQRSIVVAILRREMGVMCAAAFVVCFLAVRAASTL